MSLGIRLDATALSLRVYSLDSVFSLSYSTIKPRLVSCLFSEELRLKLTFSNASPAIIFL